MDGLPQNPVRRTGITGRGLLGQWGPNLARDHLLTRWRRDGNGTRVARKGRPLLEVLICKKHGVEHWALLGELQRPTNGAGNLLGILRKVLGMQQSGDGGGNNDGMNEVETLLTQESQVVYQGCSYDERDTDNAWVETEVLHFHDEDDSLSEIAIQDEIAGVVEGTTWAVVHENVHTLFSPNRPVLQTALPSFPWCSPRPVSSPVFHLYVLYGAKPAVFNRIAVLATGTRFCSKGTIN